MQSTHLENNLTLRGVAHHDSEVTLFFSDGSRGEITDHEGHIAIVVGKEAALLWGYDDNFQTGVGSPFYAQYFGDYAIIGFTSFKGGIGFLYLSVNWGHVSTKIITLDLCDGRMSRPGPVQTTEMNHSSEPSYWRDSIEV